MVVNGNKALVKYKGTERHVWADRPETLMQLTESSVMNDGTEHVFNININDRSFSSWTFRADDTLSRYNFVRRLNEFFYSYYPKYSAELVELDSEIPVSYVDCDKKDSNGNYYNRIIITSYEFNHKSYFAIGNYIEGNDVAIQGAKGNYHIYKKMDLIVITALTILIPVRLDVVLLRIIVIAILMVINH